jgi:DNA primase
MKIDWNAYNNRVSTAILQANRLDDLLSGQLECELKLEHGGSIFRGPCPVHGGDHHNFQLRTDGDTLPIYWRCYSHHCEQPYKASLLGLVRGILSFQQGKKVPFREAVRYLDDFLKTLSVSGRPPTARPTSPVLKPKPATWTREQFRERLVIPSPYFVARGFSPAVLDQMDVGHSPKLGRSIVPLYDENGKTCLGYASRWEGLACPNCGLCHAEWEDCGRHDERWRLSTNFPKSAYLYNYGQASHSCSPFVLLVEGAGEVWRCNEVGIFAVACLGAELTGSQAEKLAALNKKIYVAFDNDEAGKEGGRRALSQLSLLGVDVCLLSVPAGFKDVADMRARDLTTWLNEVAQGRDSGTSF